MTIDRVGGVFAAARFDRREPAGMPFDAQGKPALPGLFASVLVESRMAVLWGVRE
jgi:hypothetical protein